MSAVQADLSPVCRRRRPSGGVGRSQEAGDLDLGCLDWGTFFCHGQDLVSGRGQAHGLGDLLDL